MHNIIGFIFSLVFTDLRSSAGSCIRCVISKLFSCIGQFIQGLFATSCCLERWYPSLLPIKDAHSEPKGSYSDTASPFFAVRIWRSGFRSFLKRIFIFLQEPVHIEQVTTDMRQFGNTPAAPLAGEIGKQLLSCPFHCKFPHLNQILHTKD